MELTPELFEKTEFAERRKGYDIDQVETFMEEAGTALAQMLARVRHTEERAAVAESRISQADAAIAAAQERVQQAEQRAHDAERAAEQAAAGRAMARADEDAEVEQAAKTLLMAKRTADATVNEARGQAHSLLEEAQVRAQRQLDEAHAEAQELLRRAQEQAEAEYAERRAEAVEEIELLDARRGHLSEIVGGLEARLAGYREQLGEVAADLTRLAEDPERLGARPSISATPDEVIDASPVAAAPAESVVEDVAAPEGELPAPQDFAEVRDEAELTRNVDDDAPSSSEPDDPSGRTAVQSDGRQSGPSGQGEAASLLIAEREAVGVTAPQADSRHDTGAAAVVTDDSYVDLTESAEIGEASEDWGPGSWAQVEAQLADEPEPDVGDEYDNGPTEAVPSTGMQRDRYLEELDSAVNEAVELDDDAMKAFFEGTTDARARRFGWRR